MMTTTILTVEQQRNRFVKHHKAAAPVEFDYTFEGNGFKDIMLNGIFLGWLLAVEAQTKDEVNLYYSRTYGWKLESAESGFTVPSPEFMRRSDEDKAIEWAKEHGFLVIKVDDE